MGREHHCAHVGVAHGWTGECDLTLVAAAKSGNHQAYGELCRRHSSQVFRTILRITRNTEDAEDTLQESLMNAFVHLDGFNGRSAFSSWLTRIAINCALAQLRRRRNHPETRLDGIDSLGDEVDRDFVEPSSSPEDVCLEGELARMVRRAVGHLPPSLRGVMSLRYSHDASVEEIARVLGISEAATKTRLHRGRVALRRTLGFTRTRAIRQPGHNSKREESRANDFVSAMIMRPVGKNLIPFLNK